MRFLRYAALVLSFLLLPLWYLFATHEELLPDRLSFLGVEKVGEVPLFLQVVIADIGIEYLRIAAIHTPTPLSTAMGLIAGVIIGIPVLRLRGDYLAIVTLAFGEIIKNILNSFSTEHILFSIISIC